MAVVVLYAMDIFGRKPLLEVGERIYFRNVRPILPGRVNPTLAYDDLGVMSADSNMIGG